MPALELEPVFWKISLAVDLCGDELGIRVVANCWVMLLVTPLKFEIGKLTYTSGENLAPNCYECSHPGLVSFRGARVIISSRMMQIICPCILNLLIFWCARGKLPVTTSNFRAFGRTFPGSLAWRIIQGPRQLRSSLLLIIARIYWIGFTFFHRI